MAEPDKREHRTLSEIEKPAAEIVPIVWPALLALAAVIVVLFALPDSLRVGPEAWVPVIMAGCIAVLIALVGIDHYVWPGNPRLRAGTRMLSIGVTLVLTAAVGFSVYFIARELPKQTIEPLDLLWNGGLIWLINVLVFTVWYWEIDAGGPHAREEAAAYKPIDFVFPQFAADDEALGTDWRPNFVDYLFLAFNTSTAFSPTDTMVLSRRAKGLMMVQSLIALVVFGVLLARAVGTIGDRAAPSPGPPSPSLRATAWERGAQSEIFAQLKPSPQRE